MKIVISPAKSLDFEKCTVFKDSSKCIFLSDSEILIKKLKKFFRNQKSINVACFNRDVAPGKKPQKLMSITVCLFQTLE